ncbi:hypothetical protein [Bradyrhizobium sp. URHD0069]|uniref:hypothetical protein n=1 Tax=Bradyrhizobium sp. URHD0069 TaxID=1380355 RepID=UPI00068FAC7D|nr:hypothetical protein [Bradyrhizobium sp. URHD0069]
MARNNDHLAGSLDTENPGGSLTGFLAEEEEFDRRSVWRLGSWGVAAVGAVTLALYANQSSIGLRREQLAAADLLRQSQQIQSAAKESQNETRRLASAIDTLNSDRDRLYSRVTVLELDSATGAIARKTSAAASTPAIASSSTTAEPQPTAQNAAPAPAVSPVATAVAATAEKPRADAAPAPEQVQVPVSPVGQGTSAAPTAAPATPLVASKSMMAPPDAAATKLIEPEKPAKTITAAPMPEVVALVTPAEDAGADAVPKFAVQRTEFGVDVGGANSVGGLRALWRGLLKSRSNAVLTTLRPLIVVREGSNGLGMQLRLVAGPLSDAAAAAKICAVMIENDRTCATTVFDGQRLVMKADDPAAAANPAATTPTVRRRSTPKGATTIENPPKNPDPSTVSSLFGRR